jgi:hypothetical protein
MDKNILKIRIILYLILALILAIFLYLRIIPSHHVVYVNDFSNNYGLGGRGFIENLTPGYRIEKNSEGKFNKIISDPTYFSLFTPRKFNKVKITIKYKSENVNSFKVGILIDKVKWLHKLDYLNNIRTEDGWQVGEIYFDINNAYRENNKNTFIISSPEMKDNNDKNRFIEIKEIGAELWE